MRKVHRCFLELVQVGLRTKQSQEIQGQPDPLSPCPLPRPYVNLCPSDPLPLPVLSSLHNSAMFIAVSPKFSVLRNRLW